MQISAFQIKIELWLVKQLGSNEDPTTSYSFGSE